jgi:hypothetical protein
MPYPSMNFYNLPGYSKSNTQVNFGVVQNRTLRQNSIIAGSIYKQSILSMIMNSKPGCSSCGK